MRDFAKRFCGKPPASTGTWGERDIRLKAEIEEQNSPFRMTGDQAVLLHSAKGAGMSENPYRVLLLMKDGGLLCQLGRFLELFGFDVVATSRVSTARLSISAEPFDFFVGDWEILAGESATALSDLRTASKQNIFAITTLDLADAEVLEQALEAGFDDFVSSPLVPGELLSRLRAGARSLEFDRRLEMQQAALEKSRQLPEDLLRHEIRVALQSTGLTGGSDSQRWMVLLEIDQYDAIQSWQGKRQSQKMQERLLQAVKAQAQGEEVLGWVQGKRLAVLLPLLSAVDARKWCDNLHKALLPMGLESGRESRTFEPFTVSLGLAGIHQQPSVNSVISEAQLALQHAQRRGGDTVATSEAAKQEHGLWQRVADSGELLATATAGDVMLPCPATLYGNDTLEQADALLKLTRLPALPVINAEGGLIGLIRAEDVTETLSQGVPASQGGSSRLVQKLVQTKVARCDDHIPLAQVIELFTNQSEAVAVVQRAGRSVGLVFCQQLAALTQPIERDQLSLGPDGFDLDFDQLVVREPSLQDELEPVGDAS